MSVEGPRLVRRAQGWWGGFTGVCGRGGGGCDEIDAEVGDARLVGLGDVPVSVSVNVREKVRESNARLVGLGDVPVSVSVNVGVGVGVSVSVSVRENVSVSVRESVSVNVRSMIMACRTGPRTFREQREARNTSGSGWFHYMMVEIWKEISVNGVSDTSGREARNTSCSGQRFHDLIVEMWKGPGVNSV